MEGAAARAAYPAPGEAAEQLRPRDVEVDHAVERDASPREERVERFGLGHRAREAVEHATCPGVGLGESLADQADHDVVRHETPRVHVALRFEPERGLGRHRLAQHVTRGHVGHAPLAREGLRLGALTRARRAEKEDPEAHACARAFLRRKPS